MFSGHDSSGEGVNSLNQFVNFGIATAAAAGSVGPIDWATLAQQWIQMRDHSGTVEIAYNTATQMPEAPPPPLISGMTMPQQKLRRETTAYEEKGEADMDMDDEEDNNSAAQLDDKLSSLTAAVVPFPTTKSPLTQSTWLAQPHELQQKSAQGVTAALTTTQTWNMWPNRGTILPLQPTVAVAEAHNASRPVLNQSPAAISSVINPTAHIPSLLKMNVPNPLGTKIIPDIIEENIQVVEAAIPGMDAAKRKILPAWIREGLEKMEREKQKQLEREQQQKNQLHHEKDRTGHSEKLNDLVTCAKYAVSDVVGSEEGKRYTVKTKNDQTLPSDDDEQANSVNEPTHDKDEEEDDDVEDQNTTTRFKSLHNNEDDEDDTESASMRANGESVVQQFTGKNYEQRVADLVGKPLF